MYKQPNIKDIRVQAAPTAAIDQEHYRPPTVQDVPEQLADPIATGFGGNNGISPGVGGTTDIEPTTAP